MSNSCAKCKIKFGNQFALGEHYLTRSHLLQSLKMKYELNRSTLRANKRPIEVSVLDERLVVDDLTPQETAIVVYNDESEGTAVRLRSCTKLIDLDGLVIRHPDLDRDGSLELQPGETVTIELQLSASNPFEIIIPVILEFNTIGRHPLTFCISKEIICECRIDSQRVDLERDSADDREYYEGEFQLATKTFRPQKVRTNNNPELPMPEMRCQYELPAELMPLLKFFCDQRAGRQPNLSEADANHYNMMRKTLEYPMNPATYYLHFTLLIYLEEMARRAQLLSDNLARVSIQMVAPAIYKVQFDGLPEKRPSIRVDSWINVRESVDSEVVYKGRCKLIEEDIATFSMPDDFDAIFRKDEQYALEFEFNRSSYKYMHSALDKVKKAITGSSMRSVIYPVKKGLRECPPLVSDESLAELELYNRTIGQNPEQLAAIHSILKGSHRPAPFILFGPPGTGKTSVVAEAVKQVVYTQPDTRIIVCAASNSACDVLCEKLVEDLSSAQVLRVYGASMAIERISPILKDRKCHNFVTGAPEFPGVGRLEKFRVIVCTMSASYRFSELPNGFFTHVFLDECAFSQEPETLIPITACLKKWNSGSRKKPQSHLIIAGDIKQLGPIISSNLAKKKLEISFMERLMMDPDGPYTKPYDKTYIVKLLRNYRSNEIILRVSNRCFYDDELRAFADEAAQNLYIGWKMLPNKKVPIIMHNCVAMEERSPNSTSFHNTKEIAVVIQYVRSILEDGRIGQDDIGIISPYIAQCRRLRLALEKRDLREIKVGSVEEFQGQERSAIIISTVRNDCNLLQSDLLRRLGFLRHPKRFNVAVTRARSLLICVGNASILMRDKHWAELMELAKQMGAWRGLSAIEANNGL